MTEKVLLIDGHSIINRAFYGIPDLTNSSGLHTNAIYGFLNIFFSIYKKIQPDYVLVAFDVKQKTFRHLMYEAYKGNRKPMPEELHEQVSVLKEVLQSMKIQTVELPGYEADDILGTFAHMAEEAGKDVVILSGDRDLLQLASEKTMIALPKTKGGKTEYEEYFAEDVAAKYGVTPTEFIDLKALMGDSSDNIPGIPGIGEKTASAIISKYKSLENAILNADAIKPKRASENLKQYAQQGRMSKELATINVNSPVPINFTDGKIENEEVFFNPEAFAFYKKLELNRLLSKFNMEQISVQPEISFQISDFKDFCPSDFSEEAYGVFVDESLSVFAICSKSEKIRIYSSQNIQNSPSSENKGQMSFCFCNPNSCSDIEQKLNQFFHSDKELYVFHLKNILHAIHADDFESDHIYDISILAYLLNPLQSSYTYDIISKEYLDQILPSKEELIGKNLFGTAVQLNDYREKCFQIAANSAKTAYHAFGVLKELLEKSEMWDLYLNIEMPLTYSLYRMEKEGVQVDRSKLIEFSSKLAEMAEVLETEIYQDAGEEFNINSPAQLGTILFEKLGLPSSKKTKKGYSTSAEILEKLAPDFPIVEKILKYRQITKLRSTYAEGLVNFISSDGRIHGTFHQTITATGRISSADPNLQNIPIRMELGQEIRKAFTAKDGCIFLDADYSQIELRLLAHLSGDANLISAYNSEADIHRITAAKVFHVPFEDVTKEQRRNAKAVNFGIVYGISSFGLSQDLSISRKQASEYIRQYFETYPEVKKYLDETVRAAKINGYTSSMFGRRRPIPELASANFMQRSFGERAAMNAPLQGSAADIMKIAMINVDRKLRNNGLQSKIVLQIHDELLVETYLEETDQVREILITEMKNAAKTAVTLEVDVQQGNDWFEAH